jgi:hypothetical protein
MNPRSPSFFLRLPSTMPVLLSRVSTVKQNLKLALVIDPFWKYIAMRLGNTLAQWLMSMGKMLTTILRTSCWNYYVSNKN